MFNKFLFPSPAQRKSCRLWDNVVKYGRAGEAADDSIIRRMRFACRETKARIQTHTDNILILTAFRKQQWLRERALMLRYTYTACLVYRYGCFYRSEIQWHFVVFVLPFVLKCLMTLYKDLTNLNCNFLYGQRIYSYFLCSSAMDVCSSIASFRTQYGLAIELYFQFIAVDLTSFSESFSQFGRGQRIWWWYVCCIHFLAQYGLAVSDGRFRKRQNNL